MTRLLTRLVLAVAIVVGMVGLPAATATAASTGTISVQLTTPAGKNWKVAGMSLTVFSSTSGYTNTVLTDYRGIATIGGVPTGSKFTVQAQTWLSLYAYVPSQKDNVTVKSGKKTSISLSMPLGATASGQVTTSGHALAGARVVAVNSKGFGYQSTTTDSSGKYTLRGMPTGSYAIQFNGRTWADPASAVTNNYGWSYYNNASLSVATAKRISVTQQTKSSAPSQTKGINGAVTAGPLVTIALGTAAPGGQVYLERISGGKVVSAELVAAPVAAPGVSKSLRLISGTYRLSVQYKQSYGLSKAYFYTGPGKKLTTTQGAAALFTVRGADLSLRTGVRP